MAIGFLSSDDAEESTVARFYATVAELAHLYHCLKTQSFPVIAPLFQGTGSVETLHRFPEWLHLESLEFWQKALYIELAGECYELAPMSRNSQSPCTQEVR